MRQRSARRAGGGAPPAATARERLRGRRQGVHLEAPAVPPAAALGAAAAGRGAGAGGVGRPAAGGGAVGGRREAAVPGLARQALARVARVAAAEGQGRARQGRKAAALARTAGAAQHAAARLDAGPLLSAGASPVGPPLGAELAHCSRQVCSHVAVLCGAAARGARGDCGADALGARRRHARLGGPAGLAGQTPAGVARRAARTSRNVRAGAACVWRSGGEEREERGRQQSPASVRR